MRSRLQPVSEVTVSAHCLIVVDLAALYWLFIDARDGTPLHSDLLQQSKAIMALVPALFGSVDHRVASRLPMTCRAIVCVCISMPTAAWPGTSTAVASIVQSELVQGGVYWCRGTSERPFTDRETLSVQRAAEMLKYGSSGVVTDHQTDAQRHT